MQTGLALLEDCPPGMLDTYRTSATSISERTVFVSAPSQFIYRTVLAPCLPFAGHFVAYAVLPEHIELQLALPQGVAYRRPQRRHEHGDLLEIFRVARCAWPLIFYMEHRLPFPPAALAAVAPPPQPRPRQPPHRDGTALVQIPDLRGKQHRRCEQLQKLHPTVSCPCHEGTFQCGEGQHTERRAAVEREERPSSSLPRQPAPSKDDGLQKLTGPGMAVSIPTPGRVQLLGAEFPLYQRPWVLAEAVAPFCRGRFQKDIKGISMHPTAAALLQDLPLLRQDHTVEATMLYVDGSFDPSSSRGAWAVAVLALAEGQWRWAGFLAGRSGPRTHMSNAFDAEVYAQLVAHLVCVANHWKQAVICYDATSAAQVTSAQAAGKDIGVLQRAAAASRLHALLQGCAPGLTHTKSHEGNPGNELADSLATWAPGQPSSDLDDHIADLIRERIMDWLWLLQPAFAPASWPTLDASGTTKRTQRQQEYALPQAPAAWSPPHTATKTRAASIPWKVCTYNTLSARSALQRHSLQTFMRSQGLEILALQETRESPDPVRIVDGIYRFASAAPAGQCGCQIWVDTRCHSGKWDLRSFAIVHSHPRLLAITAVYAGQRVALLSGHARTSVSTQEEIHEWWQLLHSVLRAMPRGHIPVICADTNARWQGATACNCNAYHMEEFLQHHDLASSGTVDYQGRPVTTWRSPNGKPACLDFVMFPRSWQPSVSNLGTVDILDEHAGIDHQPLLIHMKLCFEEHTAHKTQRFDVHAMHTAEGKQCIQEIFRGAPQPSWEVGVDEHLATLNAYFQCELGKRFKTPHKKPRNPVISATTWQLLQCKRQMRRAHQGRTASQQYSLLRSTFRAWRDQGNPVKTRAHAKAFRQEVVHRMAKDTCYCLTIRRLSKLAKRSTKQDEAQYTRHAFQEAHQDGPVRLAHLIRAVLKTGRRYQAPRLAITLRQEGELITDRAEVLRRMGQHFAQAEMADSLSFASLRDQSESPDAGHLEASSMPSVGDLAHGFASLKPRKAPGLSGLPGDFYRASPSLAAATHYPLVLKMAARGQSPLLWSGSLSVPLAKPMKCPLTPAGYRAIALLEAAAKATGKAMRQSLLQGLENIVQPGTAGARRAVPMEVPAMTGQAYLDFLKSSAQTGALLYVDGVSAFYSTNRHILCQGSEADRIQWVQGLPIEDSIKQAYREITLDRTALDRAELDKIIQRLVHANFECTWFTTLPDDPQVHRTRAGTVPGAPLADLLFQLAIAASYQCMRDCLRAEGLLVTVQGTEAVLLTWLDDFAAPVGACKPSDLPHRLSRTASITAQALSTSGIAMNFAPGKSEAIVIVQGSGAQKVRTELFVTGQGTIPVDMPNSPQAQLVCTEHYVHLGTKRTPECSAVPDIQRRQAAANVVCTKVCTRLLRNPVLTRTEKCHYYFSLVLNRFLHGLATWPMSTRKERECYRAAYLGFLRRAVKPLHGYHCWRMTDQHVCIAIGALLPEEALHVGRIRILSQIAAHGTTFLGELLAASQSWLHQAQTAVHWAVQLVPTARLSEWLQQTPQGRDLLSWPLDAAGTRSFLKRVRTKAVQSRAHLEPLVATRAKALHKAEAQGMLVVKLLTGAATHRCAQCGQLCSTPSALAAHCEKVHGRRAPCRSAIGTSCQACSQEFWSTTRLREHLRRARCCSATYVGADLDPQPDEELGTKQCPVQPFHGPRPFWATLRPAPEQANTTTPSFAAGSLIQLLTTVHEVADLPSLLKRWWQVTDSDEVEATRSQVISLPRDSMSPACKFAAEWIQFCSATTWVSPFSAEGLTAVRSSDKLMIAEDSVIQELRSSVADALLFA
ncbi:unnamed protein product [Symbiodinium sp. CCMP2592]|nr:unnamed protein product [Symbiodinium sp. CCMP2592]